MAARPTTGQVILDSGAAAPIPLLLVEGTYARGESTIWSRAPERQGDPINLGPASTWKQESFEGGLGQSRWRDPKMYYTGTADTRDGTIRAGFVLDVMPNSSGTADNTHKIAAVRPVDEGDIPNLYYAQTGIAPAKVRAIGQPNAAGAVDRFTTTTSKVTAMGRSFAGGQYGLHIGLDSGKFYLFHSGSITAVNDPIVDLTCGATFIEGGYGKGDIMGCAQDVYKWDTATSKWVKIGSTGMGTRGAAYWNQRFFIISTDDFGRSALLTTDMLTIQPVHEWKNNFVTTGVAVHYGRIYIIGYTGHSSFIGDDGRGRRGQLWAYNGNSMDLIYQIPEYMAVGDTAPNFYFRGIDSYNKWLIFGHADDGVYFYDPETDSVHPGAITGSQVHDAGNLMSEVIVWNGRIVGFVYNASYPRWDSPSYRHYTTSTLITSEYDAGLAGQDKVWTEVRVRFSAPIPAGTSVAVYATTQRVEGDNGGAAPWQLLGTITSVANINNTGDGGTLKIAGDINFPDFRSRAIRLRFVVTPSTFSAGVTNLTPEIASFELDYFFTDQFKSGWTFVAQAVDTERFIRPDGNDYTLSPAEVEAAVWALRTNQTKQVFKFTDKNGDVFNVKMVALTQQTDIVQELDGSGEVSEKHSFAIGLAEI